MSTWYLARPSRSNHWVQTTWPVAVSMEAVGDEETFEPEDREKNPHAVALGRLGGKKCGKARAEKQSAEERRQMQKKAAATRWQEKVKPS
jgi:hypothetical protein